jgi:hypothetical protein
VSKLFSTVKVATGFGNRGEHQYETANGYEQHHTHHR